MPKPLTTVTWTNDVAGRARDAAQRAGGARPVLSNALLNESPRRFDRVVVMRVRRQKSDGRAAPLNELSDRRRLVGVEVVEQHNVPAAEPWRQSSANPVLELLVRDPAPARPKREPAIRAHRANQGQVVAPIHRPRFHIFLAPLDPRVRASHRDIYARFIDGDQPFRIDGADRPPKRLSFGANVGSVTFTRTLPFFLRTYPSRFIARRKLVGFVRSARSTRRLYSRHNSSLVPSGRSRTTAWRTTISIGDCQPPPRGRGVTDSVARYCATHRWSVRYPMPNNVARSWYPPSPASYAATARPRNATSYGFAMASVKYRLNVNSSAVWD